MNVGFSSRTIGVHTRGQFALKMGHFFKDIQSYHTTGVLYYLPASAFDPSLLVRLASGVESLREK